jgi:hypothetical protein
MKGYCTKCMKEKVMYNSQVRLVGTEIHIISRDKLGHKITRVFLLQ